MDRLLARLERRFGRYALDNVTYYLVGGQALVFALATVKPELLATLSLDARAVMAGQVWRLVTWLFIPVSMSAIWVLFALYWLYTMGSALEEHWGPFRYGVYWMLGVLGTLVVGFATGVPIDNGSLTLSLFLGFATLWPDYSIALFMILPVRVKWLALLAGAGILYQVGQAHGWERLVPLIAVGNYLLFFYRPLLEMVARTSHEAGRAREYRKFKALTADEKRSRKCARCGVTDADPKQEFRICDCQEKCHGKATEFCLQHALDH